MKQMYSVNLAGMLFHIDHDGYDTLRSYLKTLEKQFPEDEREEIIQEIEARLAELFTEKLTDQKQVVSVDDVKEAIEVGFS